jgi:hypothetical protein
MGKHGPTAKLWPSILGLVAAACAVAALLILVFAFPQWHP